MRGGTVTEYVREGIFRFSRESGTAEESCLPRAVSSGGYCVGVLCSDGNGKGHVAHTQKKRKIRRKTDFIAQWHGAQKSSVMEAKRCSWNATAQTAAEAMRA